MELQDYLNAIVKTSRNESFSNSPQLTLGEFINQIEKCGVFNEDSEPKDIQFDFGSAVPTHIDSWRGSYNEAAIGYGLKGYDQTVEKHPNAVEFLTELKDAIGETFTGWKGGEYTFDNDTPVWVANSGNSGNTGVVGVVNDDWRLIIITSYCEF